MPLRINNFHSMTVTTKPIVLGGLGAPSQYTTIFIQPTSAGVMDLAQNPDTLSYSCSFEPNVNWPGKYSIVSNNNSHYIQGTNATKVALGVGNFTVEAIFTPTGNTNGPFYGGHILTAERDYNNGWSMVVPPPNGFPSGVTFHHTDRLTNVLSGNFSFVNGQRYHIATTRMGNTFRIFVNGSQIASTSSNVTLVNSVLRCLSRGGSYPASIRGKIEALRVVKGLSLYNSNFTADLTQPMYLY